MLSAIISGDRIIQTYSRLGRSKECRSDLRRLGQLKGVGQIYVGWGDFKGCWSDLGCGDFKGCWSDLGWGDCRGVMHGQKCLQNIRSIQYIFAEPSTNISKTKLWK